MGSALKGVAGAVVAALALALAVGSANAYDMEISPGGSVSMSSSSLTFSDTGGLIRVVCPVTLDGTLDGTSQIALVPGNAFGTITAATPGRCTGGIATALVARGWTLTINRVLGTLPGSMTGLLFDLSGLAFELNVTILLPVRCLYGGTAGGLLGTTLIWPGPPAPQYNLGPNWTVLTSVAIPKSASSPSQCPASMRLNGTFALSSAQIVTVV